MPLVFHLSVFSSLLGGGRNNEASASATGGDNFERITVRAPVPTDDPLILNALR